MNVDPQPLASAAAQAYQIASVYESGALVSQCMSPMPCMRRLGFKPFSDYDARDMCWRCAAFWYARMTAIRIEDHLRKTMPIDAVAKAVDAVRSKRLPIKTLADLRRESVILADEILGPASQEACTRAPGSCRQAQASVQQHLALPWSDYNPKSMCPLCAISWLGCMSAMHTMYFELDARRIGP
jgi:hypothetical protein